MSSLFIGLFTVLLILDCLFLGLLVLMQLPKKDAGVGMAFGGGTADALFGAGSGNLLTQLTKYTAVLFFVFVLVLSVLKSHTKVDTGAQLKEEAGKLPAAAQRDLMPMAAPSNSASAVQLMSSTNPPANVTSVATNAPTTNTPPVSPK